MTRDEFIDGYIESKQGRWGVCERTPLGFTSGPIGDFIAVPCNCGYEHCYGWAMMPNDLVVVAIHCDLHLPEGLPPITFKMRCTRCGHRWDLPHGRKLLDRIVLHEPDGACPHCHARGNFDLKVEGYTQ